MAGLAVHIASRITGLASASEVLASQTVKDLVTGSNIQFTLKGSYELKGVPDEWNVYSIS